VEPEPADEPEPVLEPGPVLEPVLGPMDAVPLRADIESCEATPLAPADTPWPNAPSSPALAVPPPVPPAVVPVVAWAASVPVSEVSPDPAVSPGGPYPSGHHFPSEAWYQPSGGGHWYNLSSHAV
jgi:hypothetical protein